MKKIVTIFAIIFSANAFAQSTDIIVKPDRDVIGSPSTPQNRPCGVYGGTWSNGCFYLTVKCAGVGNYVIVETCPDGTRIYARTINPNDNNSNAPLTYKTQLDLTFKYEESKFDLVESKKVEANSLITLENNIAGVLSDGRSITILAGDYRITGGKLMVEAVVK